MKRRVGFGIVVGILVALVLAAPILIEAQTKKLLTIASGWKDQPIRNMVGIFSLHPEPVQVLATAASGIKAVRDMKGKRVSIGPLGSGTEVNSIQILEANGLRLEDLGRIERLDAGGASEQIKDGRIDAAVFTTGIGAAVIVDTLLTGKAVMVPVTKAEAETLQKKYPFYVSIMIPAGTYRGQDKEVPTVSVKALMVARSEPGRGSGLQLHQGHLREPGHALRGPRRGQGADPADRSRGDAYPPPPRGGEVL